MALSIPSQLEDGGDYTRWQMAVRACLLFMKMHDPRVMVEWHAWLGARQISDWSQRFSHENRAGGVSEATIAGLMGAILRHDDPADLEPFQRFVHDVIGMPYIWMPGVLRNHYEAWTVTEHGLPITLQPTLPLPANFPKGKAPRAGGADIIRNVGWLYLTRYSALPRISIKALAKDWSENVQHREGHQNVDDRKLVREGIKQAHALLDLARW